MKNIKNNLYDNSQNYLMRSLFSQKIQDKKEIGIHPDMNVGIFKAKNINEGMTISGVYISSILTCSCSEFVVIKKDAFYKNIPSQDTFFAPGQKIRVNDKDKKVESLINNASIYKLILPETDAIHFLSNRKDHIYINNIQVICGNDTKNDGLEYKNSDDLYL
jgi:hypothetical protein